MAAPWLADALRAGGLPVYEQPGWQGRGTGGTFTPLGVLLHHTAGPRSGILPSLGIVRDGRSDLQGPLAQLMLARDGVFHVIAAGRANHAGAGAARFVPANDGNRYLIGIEAESCGLVDDWTDEQRANYPRGVAALCHAMGVGEGNVLGHKEWAPTRKIDPAFWDMNAFRDVVRGWLRGTFQEDDMANVPQAEWDQVKNAVGVLLQQICGENSTLANPWPKGGTGWATTRYGGAAANEKLTLVDMLRRIDRQLNSPLTLAGRPGGELDNEYGHVLSMRAEIRKVLELLTADDDSTGEHAA
ncbi:N-acetylmuramoyl-L-alanine amidase [Pseudonocardia sp. NPDC049154]|uniref:N-acetylmuramoyl-L-alanine amidase n=1 Tax=Pseudonocardia sp. NPDC049154 TaxID=3155501 RepID=UPI00340B9784